MEKSISDGGALEGGLTGPSICPTYNWGKVPRLIIERLNADLAGLSRLGHGVGLMVESMIKK